MKKIIMAAVALIVLGGGGGGAYMYFMAAPAEAAAVDGEAGEHTEEKDEHAEDDGHGGGGYTYVELDPLILPIIDEYGLSQTLSLVVSLEVKDKKYAEKIMKMQPKLKDAYIQNMYGMLNERMSLKNGVLQVSSIKKRLNKISTKIMGEGVVNDVLLQVVQQHPI